MLDEICAEIKNYFWRSADDIFIGDFTISDGVISPPFDFDDCEYIRIVKSKKNDGVHKVSEMRLADESFHGAIWRMYPPMSFLALVQEISTWNTTNGTADSVAMSPFNSESFGGYSYSKSGGGSAGSSIVPTWQSVYASKLKRYRRLREL